MCVVFNFIYPHRTFMSLSLYKPMRTFPENINGEGQPALNVDGASSWAPEWCGEGPSEGRQPLFPSLLLPWSHLPPCLPSYGELYPTL